MIMKCFVGNNGSRLLPSHSVIISEIILYYSITIDWSTLFTVVKFSKYNRFVKDAGATAPLMSIVK